MLHDFNVLIVAGGVVFVLARNKRRTCSVFVAIGRHKHRCFRIKPFGRRRFNSMSATCRLLYDVLRCVVLVCYWTRQRNMRCLQELLKWKDGWGGGVVGFRLINYSRIYNLLSDTVTPLTRMPWLEASEIRLLILCKRDTSGTFILLLPLDFKFMAIFKKNTNGARFTSHAL